MKGKLIEEIMGSKYKTKKGTNKRKGKRELII